MQGVQAHRRPPRARKSFTSAARGSSGCTTKLSMARLRTRSTPLLVRKMANKRAAFFEGLCCCSLLPGIVRRVDVGEAPRARAVELDARVLVGKGKVRQAGRKGEEAARRQRLTLALVGPLTHSQAEGAGDDGDDLGL